MNRINTYKKNDENIIPCIMFTLVVLLAYVLEKREAYFINCCLFFFMAFFNYAYYYRITKDFLNTRGIYCLIWISTIALSSLKLSPSQVQWKNEMWFCIWLSVVFFFLGNSFCHRIRVRKIRIFNFKTDSDYRLIISLGMIILLAFVIEIFFYRGLPILSSSMSAYVDFGLPYLHYITTSCFLVPPLSLIYIYRNKNEKKKNRRLTLLSIVMLAIPILIVSKKLMLEAIVILVITYMEIRSVKRFSLKRVIMFVLILIVIWLFMSQYRNQSDEYLRSIYQLRNNNVNTMLYSIYMYIAFGIDNMNNAMGKIVGSGFGLNFFEPFFTLTGLKGILSEFNNVVFPSQVLRTYNTYSFMNVPYEDFRVFGVGLYSFLVAFIAEWIKKIEISSFTSSNIVSYALVEYIVMFTFFAPFLTFTSTWVGFIILYIYGQLAKN